MSPTPTNNWNRPKTTAIVLAGGSDHESRELLHAGLSDSSVAELALDNVRAILPPERIIVVVSPEDDRIQDILGLDLTYVTQDVPLGTGHAVSLAADAVPSDTEQVLVTYADTPLLRPASLRGLLNRHHLMNADFSLLSAVVDQPLPYGRIERGEDGRIAAIVEPEDLDAEEASIHEINVGSYVSTPASLSGKIQDLADRGEYRLTEVARSFLEDGDKVVSYQIYDTDEVQGINTEEGLQQAADIVLKRLFIPKKDTDTTIKFGTGGWRAIIGEGYTLGNLRRLCQAIANEATRQGIADRGVVIGGDRRFLSRESAEAAAEVFAGNNMPVRLLPDDVPTPLVTFAAPYTGAAYGVIITSSHNPPNWNGVKVFRADGSLPLDEETDRYQDEANALRVEDVVTIDLDMARKAGVVDESPLTDAYIDAIEEIIDWDAVRGSNLRVVVDPMYGTSQLTLGTILSDMRVRAEFIHASHNPLFGGVAPAPDSERLHALKSMIKAGEGKYDLGMATDGDSDRIGIVDENGRYVTSNELLLLLYWYLHERKGHKGGVVRNVATTHLLDRMADHFGEEHRECKVGFKHVTAAMQEIDAVLGGESSGGLTVRGWILGKDGIFACALVAEMLANTGKSVSELLDDIYQITGRLYSLEKSIPATPEMRVEVPRRLAANPLTAIGPYKVVDVVDTDGTKILLENDNWALLRFSGTEPLLRMFVEADSPEKAEELLEWLRSFVTP